MCFSVLLSGMSPGLQLSPLRVARDLQLDLILDSENPRSVTKT